MISQQSRTTKVQFPGSQSAPLSGVLHEPEGDESSRTVLITHCFTCSKDYKLIVAVARLLASRGIRVLRFDFTGTGESRGDFASTTLATNVSDLTIAGRWLNHRGLTASALVGHSLGGIACIMAARLMPEVGHVVTIASPSSSTHLLELIPELDPGVAARAAFEVRIGGKKVSLTREFVEELKRHSVRDTLAGLSRPFLVIHGTSDKTVSVQEGEKLFGYAHEPKKFVPVAGADHLFTNPEHARLVGEAVAEWVGSTDKE